MMNKRCSGNYVGTLSSESMDVLAYVRAELSKINTELRARGKRSYRLEVKPRLGKNSPHRALYAVGGRHWRWSSQTIRIEHGERFDLYLYKRY